MLHKWGLGLIGIHFNRIAQERLGSVTVAAGGSATLTWPEAPNGTATNGTPGPTLAQMEASYSGGGFGRLVVIDHGGGVRTFYAHLSRIDVIAGQGIRRGEIVGALGRSGRATAPHLHYEVRIGGNPVNPYMFLARSNVARAAGRDLPF